MDDLNKQLFFQELTNYGYPLVAPQERLNPSETLAKMLSSNDARLLEGVPVVLTNVLQNKLPFTLEEFEKSLPGGMQRRFRTLSAVTYFFLFWVPDSNNARNSLRDYLRKREPSLLQSVQSKLDAESELLVGGDVRLSPKRLETTYKNYVVQQFMAAEQSYSKQLELQRQSAFLEALSLLFTERQREVLFKVFNHKDLTKTEREYYSRTVKPRLKALRNPELQSFATTLLGW
jgi:hypothetical protein